MALTTAERTALEAQLNGKIPNAIVVGGRKQKRPRQSGTVAGKGNVIFDHAVKNVGVGRDVEVKLIHHLDPGDGIEEQLYSGTKAQLAALGVPSGWQKFKYNEDNIIHSVL